MIKLGLKDINLQIFFYLVSVLWMLCTSAVSFADGQQHPLPNPDRVPEQFVSSTYQTVVLAGGCFWGVDGVFKHIRGVVSSTAGYAGGQANTASYPQVSTGTTGHAESVQVVFDPKRISYGQLLKIYFSVVLDPTQLNYQEPDIGTQYRSVIFYTNEMQHQIAQAYIRKLQNMKIFPAPIVTQVLPLPAFYAAEPYHQNYLALHPYQPYIVIYDLPKLHHLQAQFPEVYHE